MLKAMNEMAWAGSLKLPGASNQKLSVGYSIYCS